MAYRLTQTGQEVQSILDSAVEIFWAVYGETTYAEINTAVANGALVCCKYEGFIYLYSGIAEDNNTMVFSKFGASTESTAIETIVLNIGSGQWSTGGTVDLEKVSNKTGSTGNIELALSSDDKYLSGKAATLAFARKPSKLQLVGARTFYVLLQNIMDDEPFIRIWYGDGDGTPFGELLLQALKINGTYTAKAINIGTTASPTVALTNAVGYYWFKVSIPDSNNTNLCVFGETSDGSLCLLTTMSGTPETVVSAVSVLTVATLADLEGKQDVLTFDNTPTRDSNNPVKSGGIFTALSGKQDIPTNFYLGIDNYLCIRIDQDKSFLRLDVTLNGHGIGQIIVMTTSNPSNAALIATSGIKDNVVFKKFTYTDGDGYTYLGIYHISGADYTLSIDVATLSGKTPTIRSLFVDTVMEQTPTPLTAVSYLADNADLELKQDTLVSGENIKTVNGATLLGSGNIDIDSVYAVHDNTTYDQIRGAINEGLFPVYYVNDYDDWYPLVFDGGTEGEPFVFAGLDGSGNSIRVLRFIWDDHLKYVWDSFSIPLTSSVRFDTSQSLTDTQKGQARTNIGAASASDVTSIESYIPAQASSSNQLADKNFVNSSIQTATATFKGNWETWGEVPRNWKDYYPDEARPDSNDYLVVRDASDYAPLWDSLGDTAVYEPGDIVSVSITSSTYGLYRCIAIVDYSVDPTLSPEEDTTHWEEVSSNPAYEGTWRFKYAGTWGIDGKWGWLPEYQVNEKPLTAAQLAALNSGITDTKVAKLDALPATIPTEVFWAEYGVTTAAEIRAAVSAGKTVFCNTDYPSAATSSQYVFVGELYAAATYNWMTFMAINHDAQLYYLQMRTDTGVWNRNTINLQKLEQKTDSISATSPTSGLSAKYTSEKAVYDFTAKYGVISQTQTWTQDADGGYSYAMSGQVYGAIPQANIDLFVAAGATFNFVSGYFELNGLTDISYEEMKAIYGEFRQASSRRFNRLYNYSTARTNLPFYWYGRVDTNVLEQTDMVNGFVKSKLEVFQMPPKVSASVSFTVTSISAFLYSADYMKKIINPFIVSGNIMDNSFRATSLEEIQLHGLTQSPKFSWSPNLSLASVVYMVENAANTSAITITLHATAYARCQSDTTEYTYQGNTYTGILALATAKNISIGQA